MKKNTVFDCSIVDLSKVHSDVGNITIVENNDYLPFAVKRIYYLYDVPGGEDRGGHAHYELEQYIVAASGSFDIVLDDSKNKQKLSLNRPYLALHIVPGIWRELNNFSSGSVCLVLASHEYDEKDYIREYNAFLKYKK
ncbi:FdtA/QdtA family cupin domain-containing protein [Flavobacteriaceae bacterium]|nr:FdtA/QdtA family cupin domain-containing protein [Flavobacteriaceae bacterium]